MNWYFKVLKQYVDFKGRARRQEYWMFSLISTIISVSLMLIDQFIFGLNDYGIQTVYALAVFLPGLAVTVRRLHDVGKSGWFFFIAFIPLVGAIWLLVLFCTDGEEGENKWGPNPKNPNTELDDIGVADA